MKHVVISGAGRLGEAVSSLQHDVDRLAAEGVIRFAQLATSTKRLAVVSSFGAESAVLLHLVSRVNSAIPVLFLDTLHHFQETLDYKRQLVDHLGLLDVRTIVPGPAVAWVDPNKSMYRSNPDRCCDLRKARPMRAALRDFDGWITGRKRFQTEKRRAMAIVERDADGRLKFNPLTNWTPDDITHYFERYKLPRHPLMQFGYQSIGCAPCTSPTKNGEDARSGRWRGCSKTECGIHIDENGQVQRMTPPPASDTQQRGGI